MESAGVDAPSEGSAMRNGSEGEMITQPGKRPADVGDLLGVAVPSALSQRLGEGHQEALQGTVGPTAVLKGRIRPHRVGQVLPAELGAWGPRQPPCDLASDG